VLAFVVLGVLLRVGHYLLNYPVWGDEAFVALNLPRRGYLELLQPLDYGQICPILFLWAELTAVRLLGFSELSMRLYPLLCGIASVFVFRHVAGRLFTGRALLFAVAIFAVSIHPIRHSADIKPYASDLLMALLLLAAAVEWYRSPGSSRWLWVLTAVGPVALAASYPAALVAGGIGLALLPAVWNTRLWRNRAALAAFGISVAGTFVILFFAYMQRQQSGNLQGLQKYWADSFPPLGSVTALLRWVVDTHTGSMLAYPGGGRRGASAGTLILVVIAAVVMWRRGQKTVLGLLLAPLFLTLLAAIPRLYPYGGEARIMQFTAPAICLLAGLGLGTVLGWLRRPKLRTAGVRLAAIGLAVSAVGILALELRHPYRMLYDQHARDFARRFWPEQAAEARIGCLEWDFGLYPGGFPSVRTALFLCNELIYAPGQVHAFEPARLIERNTQKLRCVAYEDVALRSPAAVAWMGSMERRYTLRRREEVIAPRMGEGVNQRDEHLVVFEFEPIAGRGEVGVANGSAQRGLETR
jgi:hypothetical protein